MNCPCGRPLHYKDKRVEEYVTSIVEQKGVMIKMTVGGGGAYWVNRHYLALHGIKAVDLPSLEKKGIVWKAKYGNKEEK